MNKKIKHIIIIPLLLDLFTKKVRKIMQHGEVYYKLIVIEDSCRSRSKVCN